MLPRPSSRWIALLAGSLLAVLLVACQKGPAGNADGSQASGDDDADSAQVDGSAVSTAQPPPPDLGDFKLVSVLLGTSLDAERIVLGDADTFAPQDKIHASVLSTGAHDGLRLSAKWLAPDGSVVAQTEQPLAPTTATATTFSIANPAGWPAGEYQLQVAVNGSTLQTRTFKVE
jgi:hypothetical protein